VWHILEGGSAMRNSSYEGMVALHISNQKGVNTVVLKRGSTGNGHDASNPKAILDDLIENAPKGVALNPYNFNVIAFDVNKKLAAKKETLTVEHVAKTVKKLGDDLTVWVSVCWNSYGKPPKLNIAQASAKSTFANGGRQASPNPFKNG